MFLRLAMAYLAGAAAFCMLDFLWLGVVARRWYQVRLASLMLPSPRLGVAALFYGVYLAGLVLFGVWPAMRSGSWPDALWWGGLYGFFTYFTYDMVNLATLREWPVAVACVDVAWGVALNALACGVAAKVAI